MRSTVFGPAAKQARRQATAGVTTDATGQPDGGDLALRLGRDTSRRLAPAAHMPGTTPPDRAGGETPFRIAVDCAGLLAALLLATGWPLVWLARLLEVLR